MTKYRTATYTPMTFLWGVTDYLTRQLQVIVMHTAHLANVSKSVTKNATFPRTGRLPCLITQQLHVSQLLGDSFSVTQRPPSRDACSHSSMHQPPPPPINDMDQLRFWSGCGQYQALADSISLNIDLIKK